MGDGFGWPAFANSRHVDPRTPIYWLFYLFYFSDCIQSLQKPIALHETQHPSLCTRRKTLYTIRIKSSPLQWGHTKISEELPKPHLLALAPTLGAATFLPILIVVASWHHDSPYACVASLARAQNLPL